MQQGSLIAYQAREPMQQGSADGYGADQPTGRIVEGGADLETLCGWVEQAAEASEEARAQAERCRDYSDNKQLTADERRELAKRGQPEVVRNKIKRKVLFLRGWEARNRSDPKAFPNNTSSEDTASDATDMLRFQERKNRLDRKFSKTWDYFLHEGYGCIEVCGPSKADPRVIECKVWRWDRLFHDPHSSDEDFEDARYKGGYIWKDEDDALEEWPGAEDAIAATVRDEGSHWGRTYDDKPYKFAWMSGVHGKRKRVRVVQIDYLWHGQWWRCIFVKGGKLEDYPLPYTDEQGGSVCPMIMGSAYVDRENNRYGEVAEWLSLQDEINKRHSKSLHLLNSAQTIGEQGAVLDVDALKVQKARPDGHIELAPGASDKFEFVEHSEKVAQNLQMLQLALTDFQTQGPNASLQGNQSGAPSGRAIRANQEGGLIEIEPLRDNHNDLKQRVYQAIWQRCRQYLKDETWIEVTDDPESVRSVGFNRQVTMAEKLADQAREQGMPDEEIAAALDQADQDPQLSEQLRQVVGQDKVLAEMDVDILIEPASESINMAHEAFEFVSQDPNMPFEVKLEMWPGTSKQKKRIRDVMAKLTEKQGQAQAEAAALQAESVKADIEGKRAKASKDLAETDRIDQETRMAPVESAHAMRRADEDATQRAAQARQGAA